jgi:hypothetical protein
MKKWLLISVLAVVLNCFQSCIPLKTVTAIDNYKIENGKPTSKKKEKQLTKYIFSNNNSFKKSISFLESKYDVFIHKNKVYITHKLFSDIDTNFNLELKFTEDKSKYLSLFNLFSKDRRDSFDPGYNKELDEPIQDGSIYHFIEITVSDDSYYDYLSEDSSLKNKLISYLQNLKQQHNFYIQP